MHVWVHDASLMYLATRSYQSMTQSKTVANPRFYAQGHETAESIQDEARTVGSSGAIALVQTAWSRTKKKKKKRNPGAHLATIGPPASSETPLPGQKYLPADLHFSLIPNPSSPIWRLTVAFCRSLQHVGYFDLFYTVLPSRLGRSRAASIAAAAFTKSVRHRLAPSSTTEHEHQTSYSLALRATQAFLASRSTTGTTPQLDDEALLVIVILACTDNDADSFIAHQRGAGALLSSRQDHDMHKSELARVSVYYNFISTFTDPVLLGVPSPFDRKRWLDLDPCECHAKEPAIVSLRKLSYQLSIRLPRLVAAVRGIRNSGARAPPAMFEAAVELAESLLLLEDPVAESDSLHKIRVTKTAHPIDGLVVPYSFEFPDYQAFEASIYYFMTHIFLHRLCLQLHTYQLPHQRSISIPRGELMDRNIRFASNILMSIPYCVRLSSPHRPKKINFTDSLRTTDSSRLPRHGVHVLRCCGAVECDKRVRRQAEEHSRVDDTPAGDQIVPRNGLEKLRRAIWS